jgi:tRNA dimethylallyltransferase
LCSPLRRQDVKSLFSALAYDFAVALFYASRYSNAVTRSAATRTLPIPVLAGPTASGKTALSLEMAARYPIEIISADAMMIYRGMDIGTAKPSPTERGDVVHHMIDLIEPGDDFSVTAWVVQAERTIGEILQRKRIPLVVGGTGFYIRSLAQGLPTTPASNHNAIAQLEAELANKGLEVMLSELERASPEDAIRAERNPRRVLRALEIYRASGKPPSFFALKPAAFLYSKVVLLPPRAELETRIEARTKAMIEAGLMMEAAELSLDLVQDGKRVTSFQAIGYKQALDHLTGVIQLEEVERRINLATRQLAKRQETWFKAEPDATIVNTSEEARAEMDSRLERWHTMYNERGWE